MIETLRDERVEGLLRCVTSGAVAAVVPQRHGVGQGDVGPNTSRDGASHLGHLEGVGQPSALMISGMDDDLGLAGKSPKRGRVDDTITVPLEAGPLGIWLLRNSAIPCPLSAGGSRTQQKVLPLLPSLPSDDLSSVDPGTT